MLAIITKMTLTQVSTWFANARRRLKKENKMTWTPRNRSEDEEEEENIDLEKNDEDEPQKPEDKGDLEGPEAGGAEQKATAGCERLQGPPSPAGKETEGSLSDSDFKESPTEVRHEELPRPPRAGGPSPNGPANARLAEDAGPHYPAVAPAPGPHPSAGEIPPGSGGPSVIHSPPPPPPPPPAVLAKPKLWSLAEIATSSDKVKDGSEGSPCPPCPGPVGGQTLGGSRASPAPAPARSPSAQCPFPGGTVLSRPLYYTAPFYPGYTNYGSFGHLHGHPGPGPGPTAGPGSHFNGLNQTVLNRADVLAKDPKMLRSQSQLDLCKDTPYELKKVTVPSAPVRVACGLVDAGAAYQQGPQTRNSTVPPFHSAEAESPAAYPSGCLGTGTAPPAAERAPFLRTQGLQAQAQDWAVQAPGLASCCPSRCALHLS
ncbi:Iroquois homeobox 5 [Cricetulus griseus]